MDRQASYAIFGLGPAAVHVLSFWLTHTLLNLIDRSTAFRILEQYRVPDSSVEDDDVDGGEPCARRVLCNQALALAVALLVSPLLRYRVGPWDASPLPSFAPSMRAPRCGYTRGFSFMKFHGEL